MPIKVRNNVRAVQRCIEDGLERLGKEVATAEAKAAQREVLKQLQALEHRGGGGRKWRGLPNRSSRRVEYPASQSGKWAKSLKLGPIKVRKKGKGWTWKASVVSTRNRAEYIIDHRGRGIDDEIHRASIRRAIKSASDKVIAKYQRRGLL